ncbi:hypothetical protein SteCoe_4103 [Stentor coeruleus]|uniref:Uncharacterized protein n=1 Tax=Stentor coeruleus TaxID=5963 RepID=A0A1R2CVI7_9CILI|nr:hypothetical protein SteCoe_4103 [Stentor coeruleus]
MKSLDTISTSTWSNIPVCIIQAINLLVEKSSKNTSEIDELKSSLSDLIIKFQVKTTRIDSTVQELTASFKTFQSSASKDIQELQRKTEENASNSEKKLKLLNEVVNEVKSKQGSFYGEFRKEVRDLNNKIEKFKTEIEEFLEDQIDRIHRNIEGVESNSTRKFNNLHDELQKTIDELVKRQKKLEDLQSINKISLANHEELINSHTGKLHELINQGNDHSKKIDAANESIASMSNVIEALSNPVIVTISDHDHDHDTDHHEHHENNEHNEHHNSELKPTQKNKGRERRASEINFISPLIAKIQELDEKIDEIEASNKISLRNLENTQKSDLNSTKRNIETWVNNQISYQINENFSKIKTKLEWLPDKGEDMKAMNVTEARLFMIESRIRGEEKARIISDQKLQTDLVTLKEVSSIKTQHRRASLSPHDIKFNTLDAERRMRKHIRARPSSGNPYREIMISQDRQKEKVAIKVESC